MGNAPASEESSPGSIGLIFCYKLDGCALAVDCGGRLDQSPKWVGQIYLRTFPA
jgi:hypothetical protein